jgi:hypothetical protein
MVRAMTLESLILELTSKTPSGGNCRIGDVCFTVRYCSDLWEWEYQGEVFFDALDLAEAIVRGSRELPPEIISLSTKSSGRLPRPKPPQGTISPDHSKKGGERFPDPAFLRVGLGSAGLGKSSR